MQAVDAQRVQQQGHGIGLVGGIDRHVELAVGADEVQAQQAAVRRVQRAAAADQSFGPALLAEHRVGGDVAMRGDAAGHQHHRRIGTAGQLVAQPQRALAGMAHGQAHVDFTAHGGCGGHCAVGRGGRVFTEGGGGGETHGDIR